MRDDRRVPLLRAVLLVLAVGLAYLPVWDAGFVWDDDHLVHGNALVRDADALGAIWSGESQRDYFPLTHTFHWLEFRAFGDEPLGYHLANLALHVLGCLLVWRVLAALGVPGAWLCALVFGVHPVTVASVAWVAEGKNTLSLVFGSAACLAWIGFARRGAAAAWAASLLLFGAALLCKTSVVGLPLVFLGCSWWLGRRLDRRDVLAALPHLALALVLGYVTWAFQSDQSLGARLVRPEGLASRVATAGLALWFYVGKLLWPTDLAAVYPRWDVDGGVLEMLPGVAWLLVLAWAVVTRAGRGRAVLFALGSATVLVGPVLGLVTMSHHALSFVADHFQYLFAVCVLALGVSAAVTHWPSQRRASGVVVAALLVAALAATTWQRSTRYVSLETLSRDTVERNPGSSFAHGNLGAALLRRGELREAEEHLRSAVELDPRADDPRVSLGAVLALRGDAVGAEAVLREALALQPLNAVGHRNLADVLVASGRIVAARESAEAAVALAPEDHEAQLVLGRCALVQGERDVAEQAFRRAVALRPREPATHNALGVALASRGRVTEARDAFETALALDPEHPETLNNLGRVLLDAGDRARAAELFRAALAVRPDYDQARRNLQEAGG